MMRTRFDKTPDFRDARFTVELIGPHDVFRFAANMLDDQCEFSEAGREALASLRDHMGADRFDPMARSMLGDLDFERWSSRGSFEHAPEGL